MKIGYLCDKKYFDTKMSRGARFHYFEAISAMAASTGGDAFFFGNGWPGYDRSKTVRQNIQSMTTKPDVVLSYKPLEHIETRSCGKPVVLNYNEMWDEEWTKREIRQSGARYVICHHWNDYQKYKKINIPGARFRHIPHCVDIGIVEGCGRQESRSDICSSGVQSPEIYPVRKTLLEAATMLHKSGEAKLNIRRHPGYRLKSSSECEAQYINYISDLLSARCALACSSRYDYTLAKMYEILATCGILISDSPEDPDFNDRYEYFPVPKACSAEHARGIISDVLNMPAGDLRRIADHNRTLVLSHNTTWHYSRDFFRFIES